MVEPNPYLQDRLRNVAGGISPIPKLVASALGDHAGTATLRIWREPDNDAGASLLEHVQGAAQVEVEVALDTVDSIVHALQLRPDLVKLDLQGGELAALRGASKVLGYAEMLIVEFGCIEAYVGRTTPRELLDVAYDSGYVLYDIFDERYRPYDRAFAGGDICFVKRSSALRAYNGW